MNGPSEQRIADLAIVGGGAAGLMAAVSAAEAGLRAVILERKHKPGRKLLMCGNARCNLTNMRTAEPFLAQLGEPVAGFARQAISQFPPADLRHWFKANGLNTIETRGKRVFPASERAADVVNLLQDLLRHHGVPLLLNSPVEQITPKAKSFVLTTPAYSLEARRILICTGGVTYPKTGSVGDGQKLAARLGHSVTPYRPGLVGLQVDMQSLDECADTKFEDCSAKAMLADGTEFEVSGDFELQRWGLCGGLVSNATRLAAHAGSSIRELHVDLFPGSPLEDVIGLLDGGRTPQQALKRRFKDVPPHLWHAILPGDASRRDAARRLKEWRIRVTDTRPLKEAMVTVGGIALDEIEPDTMQSRLFPGLYFAGEVMDVDGPTGGFNLQLAFSTARLAISSMVPGGIPRPRAPRTPQRGPRRGTPRGGHSRPSARRDQPQDRYRNPGQQRQGQRRRTR